MIEELPHGYGRRGIARPRARRGSAFGIYPARQLGAHSSTRPKLQFSERLPPRAEPRGVLPLAVIRRIVSAIRLWRARARSRQELWRLSDNQLSDIGLRRQDVGYRLAEPFWRRD